MNKADLTRTSCTLHVCTSCRPSGTPRDPQENRPGFQLHQELSVLLEGSSFEEHVVLQPAQCLSLCPRPCGIALTSEGAWTYLFGDQGPGETAKDILECVATYLDRHDGFMQRNERPTALQSSVLGRVPPLTT